MPKGKPIGYKKCCTCGVEFKPANNSHKYCTKPCKRKEYRSFGGVESTERQYELISGNWDKYLKRLCNKSNRNNLTAETLKELLEKQNYKCALTGSELTCVLVKGNVCKTNASIDRVNPKGEYTKDNIHLVCSAINKLRIDMDINEFIDWCRKVTNYAIQK